MNINDYSYNLPAERIALYPPEKRDESRLLIYNQGEISHTRFSSLAEALPENSLLFLNDTKVIPARLQFKKETGALIEIFLLNPVSPSSLLVVTMQAQHSCRWKCTVGNLKRWPQGSTLLKDSNGRILKADLLNRDEGIIEFTWNTNDTFAEVITHFGETPLPPYLKRQAEPSDGERYQTIYSQARGAVAAPTAGLHFTEDVFKSLRQKNITLDFITLHVSAGTFQPVKVENALNHTMHTEQIMISRKNIENLLQENKFIVPVGTTSLRTLESLYWYGIKLIKDKNAEFTITQTDPYHYEQLNIPVKKGDVLRSILQNMDKKNSDLLVGHSALYIYPGYSFKVCDALITNFHQPGSTLILLVAAFIGDDWKRVYEEALQKDYRFLSYGDSSLLFPKVRH